MRLTPRIISGFLGTVFCLIATGLWAATASVYVSPSGNDRNDGRSPVVSVKKKSGPVQSLDRARDIARQLRLRMPGLDTPLQIVLAPGVYHRNSALLLSSADSGTSQSPTIYKAQIPGRALITGAIPLRMQRWAECRAEPVCKKQKGIMVYKLDPAEVTQSGHLFEDGIGRSPGVGRSELYFSGKKMPLSRWPNAGFATVSSVAAAGKFEFASSEPPPEGLEEEQSAWVRGYWSRDWADYAKQAKRLSADDHVVEFASTNLPYPVTNKSRFFLFNGLTLIDFAGEWSYDEEAAKVFFLPPSAGGNIEWSVAKNLLVADGLSNVIFDGISFRQGRDNLLILKSVRSVEIRNCLISGSNGWGVIVSGTASGISDCEISETGLGGVQISGGNRNSLTSSGLFVRNSRIHDFSQRVRTYQPGVLVSGVGVSVSHNEFSHAPHSAIILSGNDHLVEGNDIHQVMREVSDGGAIYMGRDWTSRGTVIRKNYLHDIHFNDGRMVMGVYLDDQASGIEISGNVFWAVDNPVFIGGGSDNKVAENVFLRSSPAIFLDDRGLTWQRKATLDPNAELQSRLSAVPYETSPSWKSKYPELLSIRKDGLGMPRRNEFSDNLFVGSRSYDMRVSDSVAALQSVDQGRGQFINSAGEIPAAPLGVPALCGSLRDMSISALICR